MKKEIKKASAQVQEQTIQGQTLPELNISESQNKLMDERLAMLIADEILTTDFWEEGLCVPPRYFAIPKEQLTNEEIKALWGNELPEGSTIALHPLEECINNFPSGYFTDLGGDKIKPRKAEQYVAIIYGFDLFKTIIVEYLSQEHDNYLNTVSDQC